MRRRFTLATAIATGTIGLVVLSLWVSRNVSPPQPRSADQTVSLSVPEKVASAPAPILPDRPEEDPPEEMEQQETAEPVVVSDDERIDDIAATFAANPALIDALEDERDADERTRAEAQQIIEAATFPPAPSSPSN